VSALLELDGLTVHFPIRGGLLRRQVGAVHALTDVSLEIREGETLGIVGESGCGKSTLGRAVVRLYEPTSGKIRFRDEDVTHVRSERLAALRREIQMIFQDPYSSLNPRMTIRDHLEEPLKMNGVRDAGERRRRVAALLQTVGLRESDLPKYPHEFSGGQRQRIGIARALVLDPSVVIADEPVSALDVSIQSQVLNLLARLQRELGLTYLFISHDLTVVKYISARVAVMYLGRVVELADAEELYERPLHPYTRALLASLPVADPRERHALAPLEGDVPNPSAPPPGCAFHLRCPIAQARCGEERPLLLPVGAGRRRVACHFPEAGPAAGPEPRGGEPREGAT